MMSDVAKAPARSRRAFRRMCPAPPATASRGLSQQSLYFMKRAAPKPRHESVLTHEFEL